MLFCTKCGHKVHEAAPSCPGCGAPRYTGTQPAQATSRNVSQPTPRARGGGVCQNCGRSFGEGRSCQFCKQVEGLVTGVTIATPAKRLFAFAIEYVTTAGFLLLILVVLLATGGIAQAANGGVAALAIVALSIGLFIWSLGLFIWSLSLFARGQTVGKYFLGLRVLDVDRGRAASFGMMLMREVVAKPVIMVLSSMTLGIVNFWLVWDRDSQELWDKVVNTVVVQDPEGRTILTN